MDHTVGRILQWEITQMELKYSALSQLLGAGIIPSAGAVKRQETTQLGSVSTPLFITLTGAQQEDVAVQH